MEDFRKVTPVRRDDAPDVKDYHEYRPLKTNQFSSNYGTVTELGVPIEYDKAPSLCC